MKLYIAGPMTGLVAFNFPAFEAARQDLEDAGFEVESPTDNQDEGMSYGSYIKAGLRQLLRCDGVALLDGWEASVGARLEVQVAATSSMPVKPLKDWLE